MSNLREALAGTAYASLEWSDLVERAVDRVAASGRVSVLGLILWKAKYLLEPSAYHNAVTGLMAHYQAKWKSESQEINRKVVEQALSEWLGPFCVTCTGSRERFVGDLKVPCPDCLGTGLKNYRDSERAGRMKISMQQVRVLNHKLHWLMAEMSTLDRQVNAALVWELERESLLL